MKLLRKKLFLYYIVLLTAGVTTAGFFTTQSIQKHFKLEMIRYSVIIIFCLLLTYLFYSLFLKSLKGSINELVQH